MTKFETLYQITGLKDDRRYSEWQDWEACSVTCGNGTTKRTRTCTDGQYGGVACVGSTMETEETAICNDFDCPDCKHFQSILFVERFHCLPRAHCLLYNSYKWSKF